MDIIDYSDFTPKEFFGDIDFAVKYRAQEALKKISQTYKGGTKFTDVLSEFMGNYSYYARYVLNKSAYDLSNPEDNPTDEDYIPNVPVDRLDDEVQVMYIPVPHNFVKNVIGGGGASADWEAVAIAMGKM